MAPSRPHPTETAAPPDTALVIGLFGHDLSSTERGAGERGLEELVGLCRAAGLVVVGERLIHVRRPTPNYFIGSGQLDEVRTALAENEAATVVFDEPLSPVHLRNLARALSREVYDRHAIILEIFSRRARTSEAQMQVELARARYAQSHLVGMWQHLGRQGGGTRLARGAGERQIELDRRVLADRVQRAETALARLEEQRALRRKRRDALPRVALVGYTNVGKSSLMNALAGAGVRAANQLFATLDPTTRRCHIDSETTVLLSDTVGFVDKLPPELVTAFHSTLEEALEADILLLVADLADESGPAQLATTVATLARLEADQPTTAQRIIVLNKSDAAAPDAVARFAGTGTRDVPTVVVSATTGDGIATLRATIGNAVAPR